MFRKIVGVTLLVAFIAMATSGLMMMVIEKPSFTLQMHPVHKIFGLIMILAVIAHLSFNYRVLLGYLKARSVAIYASAAIIVLILLYGVALNNKIPDAIAIPMDKLAAQAEAHE
ncbi:MAG TPA: hypothetical protein DE179_04370 [Oceanospirillaceae bacterium]|nr:hypothetical protein [Oceanospirillaceae bacterium]